MMYEVHVHDPGHAPFAATTEVIGSDGVSHAARLAHHRLHWQAETVCMYSFPSFLNTKPTQAKRHCKHGDETYMT